MKKKLKICDKDIIDVLVSEVLVKFVGCRNLFYCDYDYIDWEDKVDEFYKNVMC